MGRPIILPAPRILAALSLEEALERRRTRRDGLDAPLTLAAVSQLLWAAQGYTGDNRRTVPSAGARYPLSIRLAAGGIDQVPVGCYRYDVANHELTAVSRDDPRPALHAAALDDQPWLAEAAAILAVSAELDAMREYFTAQRPRGQRGIRYAHIETGALAQNVHLEATALGLGLVFCGGFDDVAVAEALALDDGLAPLALLCIGGPRSAPTYA